MLLGQGDGTFQAALTLVAGTNPWAVFPSFVAIGDFNGDGMPDLAVTHFGGVAVLINTSTTLLSLALNPTSVTGGHSSTGTVTLSSPARGGGAVVSLTSSDATATVPSSVTVPGRGRQRDLQGAHQRGGRIDPGHTLRLLWRPDPNGLSHRATAPPPTRSSLTLSPASVTGGLESSTSTVTLNGPAPAGGARVALSSSNTAAARVPSDVTVPAGAATA